MLIYEMRYCMLIYEMRYCMLIYEVRYCITNGVLHFNPTMCKD
jgi:hypothetical protein